MKTNYYSVPGCNLPTLLERIEGLNKRCKRLGIPPIGCTTELDYIAHVWRGIGGKRRYVPEVEQAAAMATYKRQLAMGVTHWAPTAEVVEYYLVAIKGEAPKYAGWTFVAVLEPLEGSNPPLNMVAALPGETCPTHYMGAVGVCEHCGHKRRRKQTFVVRHEDGTHKAVGRSCIKDFLGHKDPNSLASWAQVLVELQELAGSAEDGNWGGGGGGYAAPRYELPWWLAQVAGVVRVCGWCSRGRAREQGGRATVDTVAWLLDPPPFTGPNGHKLKAKWEALQAEAAPTEEDKAKAEAALEWALGLDLEAMVAKGDADNYLANVAAVARAGIVGPKQAGVAGSILAAHAKATEQAAKAQAAAQRPPSKHVGAVKQRAEFTVVVRRVIPLENDWGCTLLHLMHTPEGDDMVWFCSGKSELQEGGTYRIKATPQEHGMHEGRAQTRVNRVALVQQAQAAAAQ